MKTSIIVVLTIIGTSLFLKRCEQTKNAISQKVKDSEAGQVGYQKGCSDSSNYYCEHIQPQKREECLKNSIESCQAWATEYKDVIR
jgi:hypothetical protein